MRSHKTDIIHLSEASDNLKFGGKGEVNNEIGQQFKILI